MSPDGLRFVHSGDFHLERPPRGFRELPDHLRELCTEAATLAAERVFEIVISEQADLLLLAGDVIDPRVAGPSGLAFLVGQFERLAARGVHVYWATGQVDSPSRWEWKLRLPDNVHRFQEREVETIVHERAGVPAARIMGVGRRGRREVPASLFRNDSRLPTIALAHGAAEASALELPEVNYWALGGRHNRCTLFEGARIAHYPGSPQGRRPEDTGIHGCTIVDLGMDRELRMRHVTTDVLRWHHERVTLAPGHSWENLESLLEERMARLGEQAGNTDLAIRWTVAASAPQMAVAPGRRLARALETLRAKHGFEPPIRWSTSLEFDPASGLSTGWYTEDTILGDFLRALAHFQQDTNSELGLASYLSPRRAGSVRGKALAHLDSTDREHVLREAAVLGVELLGTPELARGEG